MQVMLGMASYLTVEAHWWLHSHRVQDDDAHRDGAGDSSGTWQRTLSRCAFACGDMLVERWVDGDGTGYPRAGPPRLVGRGGLGKVTEGGCVRLWYDVFTREGTREGS